MIAQVALSPQINLENKKSPLRRTDSFYIKASLILKGEKHETQNYTYPTDVLDPDLARHARNGAGDGGRRM